MTFPDGSLTVPEMLPPTLAQEIAAERRPIRRKRVCRWGKTRLET
jgi:hypothetical protein